MLRKPLPRTAAPLPAPGPAAAGAMDDLRVLWMRDRVYTAFGLTDPQFFEELLNRNDGEVEDLILHFLNQSSDEEGALTLFFYRKVVPEEVEVEIGEPAGPARTPSTWSGPQLLTRRSGAGWPGLRDGGILGNVFLSGH